LTAASTLVSVARRIVAGPVPQDIRHVGERAMVNAFSAAVAGLGHEALEPLAALAARRRGEDMARRMFGRTRYTVEDAAMLNGALIHVQDFDDTDILSRTHATTPVAAALLALGDAVPLSGRRFLDCLVAGVEVEIALARALLPSYDRGFHVTTIAGAIGAALACGLARGLDDRRLESCIGVAMMSAIGYTEMFGSMMKCYGVATAARAGIVASELVTLGLESPTTAIDGAHGLLAATCEGALEDNSRRLDELLAQAGRSWFIPHLAFKKYPTGQGIHAPVDTGLEMHRMLAGRNAESFHLHLPPFMLGITGRVDEPRTQLEAKFDTRYCVAAALHAGRFTDAQLEPAAFGCAEILALRSRVQLVADERLVNGQAALIARGLTDGSQPLRVEILECSGSPMRPLSDDDLTEKLFAAVRGHSGDTRARQVTQHAWGIDRASSICDYLDAICLE